MIKIPEKFSLSFYVMVLCESVHREPVCRRYPPSQPRSRQEPSDGHLPIYHRAERGEKGEGAALSDDEA